MSVISLHAGWTLSGAGHTGVPATVPGCVHTDLLAAGLIPDPYLDDNETGLAWIGRTDWVYETTFEWTDPGTDRVDLVCAGLDTVATVSLNGVDARRDRQHAPRPTASTRARRCGPAATTLRGALRLRRTRTPSGGAPRSATGRTPTTSRSTSSARWRATSAGTGARRWSRPASGSRSACEAWSTARLARVRPLVTVDGGGRAGWRCTSTSTGPSDAPLTVSASVAGISATAPVAGRRDRRRRVAGRARPRPLVAARVRRPGALRPRRDAGRRGRRRRWTGGSGRSASASVRLDTAPDDARHAASPWSSTTCRSSSAASTGSPTTCSPPGSPGSGYADRLRPGGRRQRQPAAGLGRRPLRDRRLLRPRRRARADGQAGLPVRLRRLPGGGAVAAEVAAEAARAGRPAAAAPQPGLWNGNNENIWGYARLGLAGAARRPHLGRAATTTSVLPRDRGRAGPDPPVLAGQPVVRRRRPAPQRPGARHHAHLGRVEPARLHALPRLHARGSSPSSATRARRRAPRCAGRSPTTRWRRTRPACCHHQKATDGNAKLHRGLDAHLPAAARLRRLALPHPGQPGPRDRARRSSTSGRCGRICMGAIVWQLNDCWPVTSWAAVDGDGRRKPLWYALRRAYADRLLTVQPRDGGPRWSRSTRPPRPGGPRG